MSLGEFAANPSYRFKTGIPELDAALRGGIPSKLAVLVLNDAENDASTFCQQLAWAGLQSGEIIHYYTYDNHPDSVRRNMLRFGWDIAPYEAKGDFILVDCYSGRIGERGHQKYWLEKPFDVNQLMGMFRILEKEQRAHRPNTPSRGIVDSFSPLIDVLNFLQVLPLAMRLQAICKKGLYMGIAVVHRGIHGPMHEFTTKHISEGVIELYTREENRRLNQYIRVVKMALTDFDTMELPYAISPHGIAIHTQG